MKKYTEVASIADEVSVDNNTKVYFFRAPRTSSLKENIPIIYFLVLLSWNKPTP